MIPGQIIKTWTTKKNHQAVIRYIKAEEDLNILLKFVNDLIAEDIFLLLSGNPMTKAEEAEYLNDAVEKVKNNKKIHLIVEIDGVLAGACEVRIFDKRKSHVGEVGISLSIPYREEGIGFVCLETLISEAKKLNLRLLTLDCFSINERAIHLYEKVGFKKAGEIPGVYSYKGKFEAETLMYLPIV
jgi:RimJ/RimL family protein N-acetyltransferase